MMQLRHETLKFLSLFHCQRKEAEVGRYYQMEVWR